MKTAFEQLDKEQRNEVIQHAIDGVKDRGIGCYGCDLHNTLFNEDYYIIGRYQAELWLEQSLGVFNSIGIIRDYETAQFGEVNTDLSKAERVVNFAIELEDVIDLLNQFCPKL